MDSIKLKHPITVNGKKRSKLNYNAEEITGDMYAEACKKARENTNGTYETAEIDYTLQLYIGFESIIAVNSDIDLADLEIGVRGPDLVKIAGIGRTFFYRRLGGLRGRDLRRAYRQYGRYYHTSQTELRKSRVTDFLQDFGEAADEIEEQNKQIQAAQHRR